jgi:hypothetical protein
MPIQPFPIGTIIRLTTDIHTTLTVKPYNAITYYSGMTAKVLDDNFGTWQTVELEDGSTLIITEENEVEVVEE